MPPLSLRRPQQFYDRVPDRRRHAMPPCDEFPEYHAVPTPFRQPLGACFTSYFCNMTCVSRATGAIPAASTNSHLRFVASGYFY